MSKVKRTIMLMLAVVASCLSTVAVFAEGSGTANTAVTGAMQTVADDMLATGNAVVPIALTVVGVALVVVFGVRIFKRITGK